MRNETKVTINILGSCNGLKVRRGAKPGLLAEDESNNIYLFSHNRGLNNCEFTGNKKGFLSVWKFDNTYNLESLERISEIAKTGVFGGVMFTIEDNGTTTTTTTTTTATGATESGTATTATTAPQTGATETTATTTTTTTTTTNTTTNNTTANNMTTQQMNINTGDAFSAMVNGIALAVQTQVLSAISSQLDERLAKLPTTRNTTTIKLHKVDETTTERETNFAVTETYKQVLNCAVNRLPVYLFGPAGTGKTTFAMEIAKDLNLPCYIQGTTNDIFALQGIKLPNGEYIKSNVQKAVEGGGVLLFDECDSYTEEVQTWLNSLLANRKISFTDCGTIEAHKDLVIIGAGNTNGNGQNGKYLRQQFDGAFMNRFAIKKFVGYSQVAEDNINKDSAEFVRALRKADKSNNLILSYRTIEFLPKLAQLFGETGAIEANITDTLDKTTIEQLKYNIKLVPGYNPENVYCKAFQKVTAKEF